jgi:phage-related protein
MPLCRPLGDGLWEVRSGLPTRIARVLFLIDGRTFVVVHGFIKKSQRTPKADLDLARARKRQYDARSR